MDVSVEFNERVPPKLEDAARAAALAMGQAIYDESQRTVPVDTGALRRSGRVSVVQGRDTRGRFTTARGEVVYGGGEVGYAAEIEFRGSPAGRGKHFLRNAAMQAGRVGNAAVKGWKKGFGR